MCVLFDWSYSHCMWLTLWQRGCTWKRCCTRTIWVLVRKISEHIDGFNKLIGDLTNIDIEIAVWLKFLKVGKTKIVMTLWLKAIKPLKYNCVSDKAWPTCLVGLVGGYWRFIFDCYNTCN